MTNKEIEEMQTLMAKWKSSRVNCRYNTGIFTCKNKKNKFHCDAELCPGQDNGRVAESG